MDQGAKERTRGRTLTRSRSSPASSNMGTMVSKVEGVKGGNSCNYYRGVTTINVIYKNKKFCCRPKQTTNLILGQFCNPRPCLLCWGAGYTEDLLQLVINITARKEVLTSVGQFWREMIDCKSCDHHMVTVLCHTPIM